MRIETRTTIDLQDGDPEYTVPDNGRTYKVTHVSWNRLNGYVTLWGKCVYKTSGRIATNSVFLGQHQFDDLPEFVREGLMTGAQPAAL